MTGEACTLSTDACTVVDRACACAFCVNVDTTLMLPDCNMLATHAVGFVFCITILTLSHKRKDTSLQGVVQVRRGGSNLGPSGLGPAPEASSSDPKSKAAYSKVCMCHCAQSADSSRPQTNQCTCAAKSTAFVTFAHLSSAVYGSCCLHSYHPLSTGATGACMGQHYSCSLLPAVHVNCHILTARRSCDFRASLRASLALHQLALQRRAKKRTLLPHVSPAFTADNNTIRMCVWPVCGGQAQTLAC